MKTMTVSENPAPYGAEARVALPIGQRNSSVLLHGVSWDTYLRLIEETGDERRTRFAYDNGDLEIMSPSPMHEGSNRPFEFFMLVLTEELGLDFISLGSLTCNSIELEKGIEPDSCFYIQNYSKIANAINDRSALDFTKYPPPDLAVEIDITRSSLNKLTLCAALRIPEHWRYDGKTLQIHELRDGEYAEIEESRIFPGFDLKNVLPNLISQRVSGFARMTLKFRQWVHAQLKKNKHVRRSGKKSS